MADSVEDPRETTKIAVIIVIVAVVAVTMNLVIAVAIGVAACEVPVAKHGNRAASSQAGAADTLEALGLNLDRASETAEETLADLGLCFLFAQTHHPALAKLAPIRKAIGRRTIFNLLGPLCNPARATRQILVRWNRPFRLRRAR